MHYTINGGCVAYGANVIIDDIHFEIKNNEHISIVGRNGCGKTTFLKLINGELPLESVSSEQKISLSKSENLIVGYLKQISFDDYTISMQDEVKKAFKHIFELEAQMADLQKILENSQDKTLIQKYSDLEQEYEFLGGYYYKKEFETVLKKFGFTQEDKLKKLSEFSGGQCTKIAFVKLLLSKPDILLLDEPTNHLDMTTVQWLEEYLKTYPRAIITVSHDQMFLDKITDIVYEIEHKKMKRYVGNYSKFKLLKKAAYEKQLKDYALQQKKIKQLETTVEKFRYKATKASMAQSKLKQIERIDIIKPPDKADTKSFFSNIKPVLESGNDVLEVKDLKIGYDTVLSTVNLSLKKHQKLGIIGDNGLGKSTFLKTITKKIKPLGGAFYFGANVKIGYFDQQLALYQSNQTVFDNYSDEFPYLNQTEIRNDLAAFVFRGDDVFKTINMLSGGEKGRLALCKLLKKRPNVLILDEPTNHMDILGKESLENILKNFDGTIICVSHDRYFVQEVCDCLLVFDKDCVTYYPYGYKDYQQKKLLAPTIIPDTAKKSTASAKEKKTHQNPLKKARQLTSKIKKLEAEILILEENSDNLKNQLSLPENISDYQKLTDIQNMIKENEAKLDNSLAVWESLNDELEIINKNLG